MKSPGLAVSSLVVIVLFSGCGAARDVTISKVHERVANRLTGVHTQPYCWPNSQCAKVRVVVEQCGGPAPGKCSIVPIVSVRLFDARGRPVTAEFAGRGHKLTSFLLMTPFAGRYRLGTTVDGDRIERSVRLRLGHTVRAALIQPIP